MSPMTPTRRLTSTAAMFAIALVFLALASLTHEVWPLFVGWIPLLAVPWLLTRPEASAVTAGAEPDDATGSDEPQEPSEDPSAGGASVDASVAAGSGVDEGATVAAGSDPDVDEGAVSSGTDAAD